MNEATDYNDLNRVSQELAEVLGQARVLLEEYAGNRENSACLQDCAKKLHQARGPLQVTGLKGAYQLVSEMEEVIADLLQASLAQPEVVLELLMQPFLQLPDYLSRLHSGKTDNTAILLPLINSLREVRGVPVLEEGALFAPDLSLPLPAGVFTAHIPVSDREIRSRARAARSRFQAGLLEWYRGDEGNSGLQTLHGVLRQMLQDAGRESVARLWWIAAAITEAIVEGDIAQTTEDKQMYGQLDRQIKRLIDAGEPVFEDSLTDELLTSLLYRIATTESSLDCIQSIKANYHLDRLLDGDADSAAGTPFLREGMLALVREAAADMTRSREAVVEFIESPGDPETLAEVPGLLTRVRGSLHFSGQERAAVAAGRIEQFIAGELLEQHKTLSDSQLELLVDAVCSVEYCIEASGGDPVEGDRVLGIAENRLAALGYACPPRFPEDEERVDGQAALPEQHDCNETCMLADVPLDRPADSAAVQLVTDMQVIDAAADEEILAIFIEEADEVLVQLAGQLTAWFDAIDDTEALTGASRGFHSIKGSGRMVGALALGEFAAAFENLLERIIDGTVGPNEELMELLGESVAATTQLFAQVKNSDAVLQADVNAMLQKAVMLSQPDTQPADPPGEALAAMAVVEKHACQAALAGQTGFSGFTVLAEDFDPEILKNFLEEAPREITSLSENMSQWISQPDNHALLVAARRSLHTLKGNSRMAGAMVMGEFSWAMENLLNRMIGGLADAGTAGLVFMERVPAALQQLYEQLHDGIAPELDIGQMVAHADALARGEVIEVVAADVTVPIESSADEPVAEGAPADDPYSSVDSELLEVFIEEASEIIDAGENTLRDWSEQPANRELMAGFQRQLHTLKGGARMVGIIPIGDLSHTLESLLTRVVEGQIEVTPELFVLLHDSHDHLAEMLEHVKARELPADPDKLKAVIDGMGLDATGASAVQAVEATVQNEAPPSSVDEEDHGPRPGAAAGDEVVAGLESEPGPLPDTAADLTVEPEPELTVEPEPELTVEPEPELTVEPEPTAEPGSEPAAQEETGAAREPEPEALMKPLAIKPEAARLSKIGVLPPKIERRKRPRARSEQVRVRADLLDNMVCHAGEINIYRARMEQQISDYRFNLGELDQTIGRLREQLRQVEIETEAHILFRYEQEGERADQDFDPLEMDRYSNLQQLSRSLIESIGDLRSIQKLMENTTRESEMLLLVQSRVNTDLQESLLHSRMIPFSGIAPRLRRILRQSAGELGKKVDLKLEGADGEMDRTVIDRIIAPLEHMLRNAVAHGVEKPAIRKKLDKSPAGTVTISFDREGSEIVLRIEDDGAGLDIEAIRARAIERNLLDANARLPDCDIMQFVLQTGFSTAEEVTQISGRGVGMDVVNGEVKQLGGSLHITSAAGAGTVFTLRLPYRLAVNQALLVKAGEETFCIPLGSIEGVARISPEELASCYQSEDNILEYADNQYQLKHLGSLLGCGGMERGMQQRRVPVLLARPGEKRVAFQLDSIIGSREIVIKPLGVQLGNVDGISGATILGDGRVVLILDIMSLSRMHGQVTVPDMAAASRDNERLHVMVVDDSITVRKVTTRLLENNGFSVLTAKDGVDALGQLQENVPDMMLLDIEMPRMDGFELATHMRNDERLKHVPIIMITSRSGDKHREHAKKIGVNSYLGKPYQENELLESIQRLIDVNSSEECA